MTGKIIKKVVGSQSGQAGSVGSGGSTGFGWAKSQVGFVLHPDRFHARVGRVPGRPAGPVRVLKLWF